MPLGGHFYTAANKGILKDQKKGLMMKKHLIFLVFIVMVFILALVVKINNDHKKGQALNKLELVEKQIH
ncbi:TPA: hypothetical protein O9Q60_002707 [Staphylococcus aureus]|nr:hypothetical protein [Staphylococcus aureus]